MPVVYETVMAVRDYKRGISHGRERHRDLVDYENLENQREPGSSGTVNQRFRPRRLVPNAELSKMALAFETRNRSRHSCLPQQGQHSARQQHMPHTSLSFTSD